MNIVFRVDASLTMGSGHLMRCLTLANCLHSHGAQIVFICRHLPESLHRMLFVAGHSCVMLPDRSQPPSVEGAELAHAEWLGTSQSVDAEDTLLVLGSVECNWLIVDHYALDVTWERKLRHRACRILVIDDLADRMHDCDLLLDQNLYTDAEDRYLGKVPNACQQLLGPRYALLRPEFAVARRHLRTRDGVVRRILLFFGGMDSANVTGQAMAALAQLHRPDIAVDVVIGAQHPALSAIEVDCQAFGWACHVQSEDMATLMAAADIAIGAGGSATWERCSQGLPTIALAISANQKQLVEDAASAGILLELIADETSGSTLTQAIQDRILQCLQRPQLLLSLALRGTELVDGAGVERVRRAIGVSGLSVRRAVDQDSEMLFRWRNHEKVRAVSHNNAPLQRDEHESWIVDVLANPLRILLIGEFQSLDIGVVRFDCEEHIAEVSIYLNPEEPSTGWGRELLQTAEKYLASNFPNIDEVCAEVLLNNLSSQNFFERSGYVTHVRRDTQSPVKKYYKSLLS